MARWSRLRKVLRKIVPDLGDVQPLPERIPLDLANPTMLDVVMHEYDAIRSEVDHSLSNQVSILSFGAATVGLLVAAAGALWTDAPLLAGLLLLVVVPVACFLTRAIHAGELVRLMRAGLFLHELENWVNQARWPNRGDRAAGVLRWEQWDIRDREQQSDVDRHSSEGITLVFGIMAYGFMLFGFYRLHTWEELPDRVAVLALVGAVAVSVPATLRVRNLIAFAYRHRDKYSLPERPRRLARGGPS
jgi:hypothetical protein